MSTKNNASEEGPSGAVPRSGGTLIELLLVGGVLFGVLWGIWKILCAWRTILRWIGYLVGGCLALVLLVLALYGLCRLATAPARRRAAEAAEAARKRAEEERLAKKKAKFDAAVRAAQESLDEAEAAWPGVQTAIAAALGAAGAPTTP